MGEKIYTYINNRESMIPTGVFLVIFFSIEMQVPLEAVLF